MKTYLMPWALALVLGACASTPTPLPVVLEQQAVVSSPTVTPIPRRDPLDGFVPRPPTGPRDWRKVNQEQSEGN